MGSLKDSFTEMAQGIILPKSTAFLLCDLVQDIVAWDCACTVMHYHGYLTAFIFQVHRGIPSSCARCFGSLYTVHGELNLSKQYP